MIRLSMGDHFTFLDHVKLQTMYTMHTPPPPKFTHNSKGCDKQYIKGVLSIYFVYVGRKKSNICPVQCSLRHLHMLS